MHHVFLTRRSALLLAACAPLHPARADGPVFLGYTQEELDRAYDQARWASNGASVLARYASDSAAVRRVHPPRTERYGPGEAELLDVFAPTSPTPSGAGAPVLVFLHGGAWLRLTRGDVSAPAPTFMDRGGIWIAPDFGDARQLTLAEMAERCRRVLEWVVRNAMSFGGDPSRVFLAGHSSGAHLAAVLLTTDWGARGLSPAPVRGALLMRGPYDLYPVMLSSRRSYLRATAEEVAALSPLRHLDRLSCPVTVVWADHDSPEFKRQSGVLADALGGMGLLAGRHVLFDTNHFEEPEQLNRPDTLLGHAALAMMGLA